MIEGFYSIAFTGHHGSGFGIVVFHSSTIVGADAAGATYDGVYQRNIETGTVDLKATMRAGVGIVPVQTGLPLTAPLELPLEASLPENLGGGSAMLLQTPLGPINIVFKKIRGFPD